jgi:hypothetical protein
MTDTSVYTKEYRIIAATLYHESTKDLKSVKGLKRKLREEYPDEPPDTRVIKTWEEKLFKTGSINDLPRAGRPNERGDEEERVENSLEADPRLSVRQRANVLNISQATLYRIMAYDLGYKSWKPTMTQFLNAGDHANRVHCCRQILEKYDNNIRRDRIFFTDECAVYAEGRGNANLSFWSKENPHFWEQVQQHPPSVMIWAAISATHLIGPFFISGSVTSQSYIDMLRNQFLPVLRNKRLLLSTHFQQDGAPAHTAHATRNFFERPFKTVG